MKMYRSTYLSIFLILDLKLKNLNLKFQVHASGPTYNFLLNVLQSPEASGGQIKQAYYGMMKECHPDLTGEHPDSTAFCKFINEVYEVIAS
jgi:hypothetical protein